MLRRTRQPEKKHQKKDDSSSDSSSSSDGNKNKQRLYKSTCTRCHKKPCRCPAVANVVGLSGHTGPHHLKGKICEGQEWINPDNGDRWIYQEDQWILTPCCGGPVRPPNVLGRDGECDPNCFPDTPFEGLEWISPENGHRWIYQHGRWHKEPHGSQGPQGPPGENCTQEGGNRGATGCQGPTGHHGEKGSTICVTSCDPIPGRCRDGDVWINDQTGDLFHCKRDCCVKVLNLKGVPGCCGDKGDCGDQGDCGAQGPQGATGAQGHQGATGSNGMTGCTGNVIMHGTTSPCPQTNPCKHGDVWINVITGDIYFCGNLGWSCGFNIKGTQGPQGPTGAQGSQGATGATGSQGSQGSQRLSG